MGSNPLKRKLAAILAADAVGYSRLMAADEEGTMKILSAHRAVIDGIIEFHEGRLVGTAGDSVLAEFASPVEAVRCAVEIQAALRTRNDSLPEDKRLQFRIGVNLGDVMVKGDDLLGDGVNVAARLESIAEPGGICVSSSVYDQIAGKLDLGFVDIGDQSLKNIDRPVHVYRLEREGATGPRTVTRRPPRPGAQAWLAGVLVASAIVAALAWYFDLLPVARRAERPEVAARSADERAKAEQELARARTEAEEAKRRAETEAAAAAEAKRQLEEQRAAGARARAEAELSRARADAGAARRKAEAELAAAEEARRAAQVAAKAAAVAKPAQLPEAAPKAAPPALAEPPRVAAQAPSTVPSRRYAGRWTADFTCPAFEDRRAFDHNVRFSVTDDVFLVQYGERDQPGSFRLHGIVEPDGRLQLVGGGVSPHPKYVGQRYRAAFDGKFEGERYGAAGHLGAYKCALTISRAP